MRRVSTTAQTRARAPNSRPGWIRRRRGRPASRAAFRAVGRSTEARPIRPRLNRGVRHRFSSQPRCPTPVFVKGTIAPKLQHPLHGLFRWRGQVGLLPPSLRQLVRGLREPGHRCRKGGTSRTPASSPGGMLPSLLRPVMTRPGQNGVLAAALERSAESAQNRLKCHKSAPRSSSRARSGK